MHLNRRYDGVISKGVGRLSQTGLKRPATAFCSAVALDSAKSGFE